MPEAGITRFLVAGAVSSPQVSRFLVLGTRSKKKGGRSTRLAASGKVCEN
jgi:hypothetical protein